VFAGFLTHADAHIGRMIAALDDMGIRDDTLVILVSDNGASQEGLRDGTANTDRYRNYTPDTVEEMAGLIDQLGGPDTDPHYPMGWAMAGNAPLKRWKQDTHAGGNTDPFIVSWPGRIKDPGGIRRQYHHVVDVVPMLLELTGLPAPTQVSGVEQMPLHGVSMAYTLTEAPAPTRKTVQYYEMLGSRAIWSHGWAAVAWHKPGTAWEEDRWELYHTDADFSQARDLAAAEPERLAALKALWQSEAEKNGVLPLDDRRYERVADPSRPTATISKPSYTYYPGTSIVHPLAGPQLLGRPHRITARVHIPEPGAEGVLASSGGEFGGWSLFLKDGKLHYVHNYLKINEYAVSSADAVAAGRRELAVRFTPTASSLRPDVFTGDVALFVDGKQVGSLEGIKMAGQYSALTGYGLTVGRNSGTAVSHAYETPFPFTGSMETLTVQVEEPR
jgi:arylsulfatase